MDNSRIPIRWTGWYIPWKTRGKTTNKMGRKYQEKLLVAAGYKRMDTVRGIWVSGGELLRRPGPYAGCGTIVRV